MGIKVTTGGGTGVPNDGSTWEKALSAADLAARLGTVNQGNSGAEFWLASGYYPPLRPHKATQLYGGFAGTELTRGERNPSRNPTTVEEIYLAAYEHRGPNFELLEHLHPDRNTLVDGCTIYKLAFIGSPDVEFGGPPLVKNCEIVGGTVSDAVVKVSGPLALDACEIRSSREAGAQVFSVNGALELRNCRIHSNLGAGLVAEQGGRLTMTECLVEDNGRGAASTASGIFVFDAALVEVRHCKVRRNKGEHGGGFHVGRSAASGLRMRVENCLVEENKATLPSGGGGGVYCRGATLDVTFENCRFYANTTAGAGGAIHVHDPGVRFIRCAIEGNESGLHGGGVSVFTANRSADRAAVFRSCLVAHNKTPGLGGGIYVSDSAPQILNCTIVDNEASSGGAIGSYSALNVGSSTGPPVFQSAVVANCALVANRAVQGEVLCHTHQDFTNLPPPPQVSHSAYLAGQTWRTSSRTGGLTDLSIPPSATAVTDAGFVSLATGDYRLAAGSPLIDRGNELHIAFSDLDLDGLPRVSGASVDIGAFERRS